MYEQIDGSMYDDLRLRCYLIFSLQDFDKSGAYAEILEGVAKIIMSLIILITASASFYNWSKLNFDSLFTSHFCSDISRKPLGYPVYIIHMVHITSHFFVQIFHGNLWDIHMVPASRKAGSISKLLRSKQNMSDRNFVLGLLTIIENFF